MVSFQYDNISAIEEDGDLKTWLIACLADLKHTDYQLSYIFVSDDVLLSMNQEKLKHNTYTDILTFDLSDNPNELAGEIYISLDRVRENSVLFGVTFAQEIKRVMIHGVLHLIGFNDSTDEEKKEMRKKEDYFINL